MVDHEAHDPEGIGPNERERDLPAGLMGYAYRSIARGISRPSHVIMIHEEGQTSMRQRVIVVGARSCTRSLELQRPLGNGVRHSISQTTMRCSLYH